MLMPQNQAYTFIQFIYAGIFGLFLTYAGLLAFFEEAVPRNKKIPAAPISDTDIGMNTVFVKFDTPKHTQIAKQREYTYSVGVRQNGFLL